MLDEALAGYGHYLDLLREGAEPDAVIQAFDDCISCCVPCVKVRFGVGGLNERLEQVMAQKRKIHRSTHSRWYEGEGR